MKKTVITILSLAAFIGGFIIFYNPKPISNPTENNSQGAAVGQKWESKIDEQASVTVTVTPTDISTNAKEWKFDIVMNTHSVELDQDMVQSSILYDDQGREYRPVRWDGPSGGHHREGVLVFNPIIPMPKSVELKITGIADVVRTFTWQLNN